MLSQSDDTGWDFSSAIELLRSLSVAINSTDPAASASHPTPLLPSPDEAPAIDESESRLGDFGALWSLFGRSTSPPVADVARLELAAETAEKGVRWRDELDGADLEDNVELKPVASSAGSQRTRKRAERRARARARAGELTRSAAEAAGVSSAATTDAESGEELRRLRRSPDRRAVIQDLLGRGPKQRDSSTPPTSPSPPKSEVRILKREWHVSDPFVFPVDEPRSTSRTCISPRDGFAPRERKAKLISSLSMSHAAESKFLKNAGLVEPEFTPLNVSKIGIHVFVDISNIMIGFHDSLKASRDIPISTRVRRVPMCFHNFSLVLERGRPAAKRVLVGSDRSSMIDQANSLGYETNILERVHKVKEVTHHQRKFQNGTYAGVSSGSDTNAMTAAPQKWVEQAVDEILHLKILESLIDADKPSTIVLATGDAAEAEYSGGFMRMVERALEKGWTVELVSFRQNTSSAYKRKGFRTRWGSMFKWIQLDPYVELLMMGSQ